MALEGSSIRRPFVGGEVGIVFGMLLAGSALVMGGFVPWYLAVLFASGLGNAYLASLGSGMLFYGVAIVFLYVEAVVLTTVFLGLRHVYRRVRTRTPRNASV